MDKLRDKTLAGLTWGLLERIGNQVISFLPTIILARLLTPEQFGLVGMLSLFTAVAAAFLDSGFSMALIQKKDATYVDECSIFYFNLFVGGILTLALFLAAPLIADFYNQPALTNLTRVMSLQFVINAFDIVQTARLVRKLDFKTKLKAKLIASFISGVIGIVLAYLGCGVWSLVAVSISELTISAGMLWILCDWRPGLIFSLKSLKEMFSFGSRMLASSLVYVFFNNIYQTVIGKVFSAASLGYYSRAATLRKVVQDTVTDTVGRVLFPSLNSIRDDEERLRQGFRKAVTLSTFVFSPVMIGLIVVARPLITILFSEKWESCVIFFQLMCAGGLLLPLSMINQDILIVKGRPDLFLRLTLVFRATIIANIVLTYRWGISAMLLGQVVCSLIVCFLYSYYSGRMLGYSTTSQILDILPSFVFSGLMGGGAALVGMALKNTNSFILLVAQSGAGLALYLLLAYLSSRELLFETIGIVKRLPGLLAKS